MTKTATLLQDTKKRFYTPMHRSTCTLLLSILYSACCSN